MEVEGVRTKLRLQSITRKPKTSREWAWDDLGSLIPRCGGRNASRALQCAAPGRISSGLDPENDTERVES